jgi:hypothetical protein
LNAIFQANLHNAIVGGLVSSCRYALLGFAIRVILMYFLSGQHTSFGQLADSSDKHGVTPEFLDKHASDAWEVRNHHAET